MFNGSNPGGSISDDQNIFAHKTQVFNTLVLCVATSTTEDACFFCLESISLCVFYKHALLGVTCVGDRYRYSFPAILNIFSDHT
jgi:hypothetical protein